MSSVRKRGKTWNAQVRVSGWRSFTKSFKSKSDANNWASELEQKLFSASIPNASVSNKVLLRELVMKYADEVTPQHKGRIPETYRLNSIAQSWIGGLNTKYLTKQHFIQYRDDRMNIVAASTVGSELSLIKRVLDTASKRWGYGIPYNPIKDIEFTRVSKTRTRRLEKNEKQRLLSAAWSQKNIYIAFIIEFAIETGMRRSEILKLRWCDIDFTIGFAFLSDTKNGEDRKVPLTKRCVRLLQKQLLRYTHLNPTNIFKKYEGF